MAEASRATWHRAIWQRLPRQFRRAALFRVASIIAPRINQDAPFAPPLIVVGSLKTASGLGQSARLCHDALRALELPTLASTLVLVSCSRTMACTSSMRTEAH